MQVFSHIYSTLHQSIILLKKILFPSHCLICKIEGSYLCNDCKSHLIPHPEICPSCHKLSHSGFTCFSCKEQIKSILTGTIIAFSYSKEIKKCIYAIKFYHRYDIAHFLAKHLALQIQSHPTLIITQDHTLITRVPSHRTRRFFQKGYNQSKILALETAKILGIPASELVTKIKNTKSQVSLSRTERLQNLLGAFRTNKQSTIIPPEIKKIIIIDDITTTGSTLEQVGKSISQQYPSIEIRGCVVARHN